MKTNEIVGIYVCDFCKRKQDEVRYLVAAPNDEVHICNDCASLALDLICEAMKKEKNGKPMKKRKTLDAFIKLMNEYCNDVVESGECCDDCIGIGWCSAVVDRYETETNEGKGKENGNTV